MVEQIFSRYIRGGSIKISEDVHVSVDKFKEFFGDQNITYENLIRIDDGELGYASFFEECKQKGILI